MPNPQPGPRAIVRDFANGVIDTREDMLKALADFEYTSGRHVGYDGYIPGTFDELAALAVEHTISRDELDTILSAWESRHPDE